MMIMFVIINLIFYFGFDSSDESGEKKQFNTKIKTTNQLESDLENNLFSIKSGISKITFVPRVRVKENDHG